MFAKVILIAFLALVIVEGSVVPVVKPFVPVVPVVKQHPQPYAFGYKVKAKDGEQFREEISDGVAVKGSYGFDDARGIRREVKYIADGAGFRAQINTNEPGTANQNPANVQINSFAPYGNGGAVVVPVVQKFLVPQVPAAIGYGYDRYGI